MTCSLNETIPDLLVKNINLQTVIAIKEALDVGANRAYRAAHGMNNGHLPHIVGQLRHFHMNETFQQALASVNASPTPIRGNNIVTGREGIFTLGRFNIKEGVWINGRRSHTRKQMSMANVAIEPLIQPELFTDYTTPSNAAVFFVACFAGSLHIQPESPVSIQIAVPDRYMQDWLFKESVDLFINRYEKKASAQHDFAIPKLKKDIGKKGKEGTSQ